MSVLISHLLYMNWFPQAGNSFKCGWRNENVVPCRIQLVLWCHGVQFMSLDLARRSQISHLLQLNLVPTTAVWEANNHTLRPSAIPHHQPDFHTALLSKGGDKGGWLLQGELSLPKSSASNCDRCELKYWKSCGGILRITCLTKY